MNTEEVMPAKHVIDAALTFKGKAETGTLLGNWKRKSQIFEKHKHKIVYMHIETNFYHFQSLWLVIEILCPP